MVISIKKKSGKWTVNGKVLTEMNYQEKTFMDNFFKEIKISKRENID